MSDPRKPLLEKILLYELPIEPALEALAELSFDSGEELILISASDILRVIDRCIAGELSMNQATDWADLLEMRDGVGFDEPKPGRVSAALSRIANPNLFGELTLDVLQALKTELTGRDSTEASEAAVTPMNQKEHREGLSATPGYRYAKVVGNQLHVAGQVPTDAEGNLVGSDAYTQASACLSNLRILLRCHGFNEAHIQHLSIYAVGSREVLQEAWRAVREHYSDEAPPSTLLGVKSLGYENQIVEIDATIIRDP